MSSPSRRIYSIVDQSLSLKILFDSKTIEGYTSVRMKMKRGCLMNNILQANLCAKQMDIKSLQISDLQLFNKETNDIITVSAGDYSTGYLYPTPQRQISIVQRSLEQIQPSTYSITSFTRQLIQSETTGFLQIRAVLKEGPTLEMVKNSFMNGYEAFFTVKIEFKQIEPVGGAQFLKNNEGSEFFFKDNKICYSRSVFPCLDYLDDFYNFSGFRIATDRENYSAFILGEKRETQKIDNLWVIDFKINRVINPNYLCLMVGEFSTVRIPLMVSESVDIVAPQSNQQTQKASNGNNSQNGQTSGNIQAQNEVKTPSAPKKFINFYCISKEVVYNLQRRINEYTSFFSTLMSFEKSHLKMDEAQSPNITWILLDNMTPYSAAKIAKMEFCYSFDTPYFYDTVILDSTILLDKKSLDTDLFIQCDMVRRLAATLHLDKIAMKNFGDFWMYFGICCFIGDAFLMLESSDMYWMNVMEHKRARYYKFVEHGKDVNPLTNPFLMHPAEIYFDECLILKSNLIFSMIFSFIKQRKNLGDLAGILLSGDHYFNPKTKTVRYVDSSTMFKKIKLTFGIKNLKHHLSKFLSNTGTVEIDAAYSYNRKDNKMKFSIRQTPLHLKHYRKMMEDRFKLEKQCDQISPIQKIFDSFKGSLLDLTKDSDGYIEHKSVNSFLQDDGRILVNSRYNSLKYLSGLFDVIITETNEIELREDIYEIKLEDQQEQEIPLYLRGKFRRTVQRRGYNQEASISLAGMGDDHTSVHNERSGNQEDTMVGGAPYLWIKLDPYNNYLRKIKIQDGENILLAQLEKDMKDHSDLQSIYRILENLRDTATEACVNKLCSYILDKKQQYSEFLKIEMVNTLTNFKLKGIESRIYDILISLAKQIKFEEDDSLKPNDFSPKKNYHLLNHLVQILSKYERKLKKATNEKKSLNPHAKINRQTDDTVVELLLSLLQKNDNSYNAYHDFHYQANILRSLFRCLNLANFPLVITEVNRLLRIEFYTKYYYKFYLEAIFEDFVPFVTQHFSLLGISLASSNISFYENTALSRFPKLMNTVGTLKKLAKRHQNDSRLAHSIFRMKIIIKRTIHEYKPWELLTWALKYIEKLRQRANPLVLSNVFRELIRFIEQHLKDFRDMQIPLSMQNQKLLNKLLFETVNCPYALTDFRYRYLALRLYKTIYNDFLPICHMQGANDHIFPLDLKWLNFQYSLNFEKSISNEAKMITLNHLNLQKRKKAISGPMGPAEGSSKYNLRDLLLQNFRFNKENMTWMNLGKQLVNVLLGERSTITIENDIEEEVKLMREKGEPVSENIISLASVKRRIIKGKKADPYTKLDDFEADLFKIVGNYLIAGYINQEVHDEYIVFIKAMLSEIVKIVNERLKNEEEKLRRQRTRISLRMQQFLYLKY